MEVEYSQGQLLSIVDLLVFHRKDLCEAKHKTASVFKFSDDVNRADGPPCNQA